MRFPHAVDDFDPINRGLEEDLARIPTRTMRQAAKLLQQDLFDETVGAMLGYRLAKTWRTRTYPQSADSLEPAGWVWTKAPVLIDAFDRGVTITAKGRRWLAIPTEAAGKRAPIGGATGSGGIRGKSARITPAGFEARTGLKLRFVYQGPTPSLLVVDGARRDALKRAARYQPKGRGSKLYGPAGRTIVVFILLRQVRLKKRLELDGPAFRASQRWEALLTENWRA